MKIKMVLGNFFKHLGITVLKTRIKRIPYFVYIIVKLLQAIVDFFSLGFLRITWAEDTFRWALRLSE